MPLTIGSCLEYAIYRSPLPFIRTLLEILKLLLAFRSDPDQRGINDYTPLHMAIPRHSDRPWQPSNLQQRLRLAHMGVVMEWVARNR